MFCFCIWRSMLSKIFRIKIISKISFVTYVKDGMYEYSRTSGWLCQIMYIGFLATYCLLLSIQQINRYLAYLQTKKKYSLFQWKVVFNHKRRKSQKPSPKMISIKEKTLGILFISSCTLGSGFIPFTTHSGRASTKLNLEDEIAEM